LFCSTDPLPWHKMQAEWSDSCCRSCALWHKPPALSGQEAGWAARAGQDIWSTEGGLLPLPQNKPRPSSLQPSHYREYACPLIGVTYLLTPCSTVLPKKPTSSQQVKKFPAFYGTRRFITTFTSAHHLTVS